MLRRFCGCTLIAVATSSPVIAMAEDAPSAGAGQIVMLTSEEPKADQGPNERAEMGLLVRELARQAVLIAARDELGLQTRDQTLREPFPSSAGKEIELHIHGILDKSLTIELTCDGGKEKLWTGQVPLKVYHGDAAGPVPPPTKADYRLLVEALAPLTHREMVDALKKAGFAKQAKGTELQAAQEGAEALLQKMYFIPQFMAVRNAHDAVRAGDSSPQMIGTLVRGYANLGQLTILYWNASPKVYIARSLLYAQRMVSANPNSADALWHRAYARTMAGFHADALEDLKKASELAKDAKPPVWVELLDPYCKFNTRALLDLAAADKDRAPLATFLCYLTVEYSSSRALQMEVGQGAMEINPLSDRIVEAVADKAGVGPGHELSLAGHRAIAAALLTDQRLLPPGAQATFPHNRRDSGQMLTFPAAVAAALLKAADEDHSEPSWGALGRMVQEINFLNVHRRMYFENHMLAVDSSDYLQAAMPLIADHPYRAYIEAMGIKVGDQKERVKQLTKQIKIVDLELQEGDMFDRLSLEEEPSNVPGVDNNTLLSRHADSLPRDMWYRYETLGQVQSWARLELAMSPDTPWAAAAMIDKDWAYVQPRAAEWEKRYGYHPDVLKSFAYKYSQLGQNKDAERNLEAYIKKASDYWAYERLASLYLKDGNEDKWLATMKASLKQEDLGLDHATTEVAIARHYMDKSDYQTALPYANEAAESWAGWAMEAAAECETGLKHYDAAQTWLARINQRYNDPWPLYFWCCKTGRGPIEQARQTISTLGERVDPQFLAAFYLADGQTDKALDTYRSDFKTRGPGFSGLYAAVILDEKKDAAGRDAMLKEVVTGAKRWPNIAREQRAVALAERMIDLLTKGINAQTDAAAARSVIPDALKDYSGSPRFLAGKFLLIHGQPELAKEEFLHCFYGTQPSNHSQALASIELHKLGMELPIMMPKDAKKQ